MSSRHETAYPVLNGPHSGEMIVAPSACLPGTGVSVGWSGPKGLQYAVYVLIEVPEGLDTPAHHGRVQSAFSSSGVEGGRVSGENPVRVPRLGLAYMRSWPTPADAQRHVNEITLTTTVAREVAQSN